MTHPFRRRRPAFTLIELLVVMSVMITLASIALLVVPDVIDQDRTTDGASSVRQWLMIAKARAARDGGYRGLRLLTGLDSQNPAKTNPNWVTECQYIEAPPAHVPNPNALPTGAAVVFTYTLFPGPVVPPAPPNPVVGQVMNRQCQITGLRFEDAAQVVVNGRLMLRTIGTSHRITGVAASPALNPANPGPYTLTVGLDSFPDAELGAAGMVPLPSPPAPAGTTPACFRTFHFGIMAPARPLVGEPTLPLPRNTCIDISPGPPVGIPANQAPPTPYAAAPSLPPVLPPLDYDILFTPTGHVLSSGAAANTGGQIYLWVRDYTKTPTPLIVTNAGTVSPFTPPTYDLAPFQAGGAQQIVALKTFSGSLGVFPVLWPNGNGQYTAGDDPYTLARLGANAP